jgi:uncharacterized membrane protein YdbT with pleckstrin-like domain
MASYVESVLREGEKIKFRSFLHWVIFLRWLFLAFIISFIIITAGVNGLVVVLVIGFCLTIPIIQYKTSEFCVTNKRVIIKIGFISRKTIEMNLDKVEGVSYDQSILGRILGYGTIYVRGTGGTPQRSDTVSSPMLFQKAVNQEIENLSKPDTSDLKKCPQCAEFVKKDALKCKHCGYDFK